MYVKYNDMKSSEMEANQKQFYENNAQKLLPIGVVTWNMFLIVVLYCNLISFCSST